jgi:transcriptional regulator with XRE-family HTH domain
MLRAAAGVDQEEVAAVTGLTQSTISRLENGQIVKPGIFEIHALAWYYGVSLDSLTEGLPIARLRKVERPAALDEKALTTAVQEALAILSAAVQPAPANTAEQEPPNPNGASSANKSETRSRELAVAR